MKRVFVLLLCVALQGQAATICDNATTTIDMLKCANLELSAADEKLNNVYGRLLIKLDAEGQKKLTEAQRAWIKYRDLNAIFAGDIGRGGTAESLNIVGAKTWITLGRAKELRSQLDLRN